jgi:hypothetical protein
MAEAHAAPHRGVSVPVEIGASSLLPFLTCLDSPRRASDSLSSPQAGGAGRANGARLDGVARAWPARQKQANKFLLRRVPRTNSGTVRCPRNRCREPLQIEPKALTKMRAVGRNIDFVGVSEKAPASGFAWVAARVRIICCYASAIPQPICEAMAELFSCRPKRAPNILQATIFPSAETMHHTSVRMRFRHAPIARRCDGERPLNRRAPVDNSALHQATRMSIGRHCARRRPNDLRIWGCWFHVRS